LDRARRPTVRHSSQLDQEKQKAGDKRASDGGNIDNGTGSAGSVAAVYARRKINESDFAANRKFQS